MADDLFEQYPTYRWVIGGFDIAIPASKITHNLGKRLAPHERLYRKGARHDDMGTKPDTWEFQLLGHNDSEEDGIPPDYYPRVVNQLEDSMEVEGVGTLYTLRGPRRCLFTSMNRTEDRSSGVDAAVITAIWTEDNEDDATAAAFQAPSARSVAQAILLSADTSLASIGVGGGDFLDSLKEAVRSIVALAEAPGDAVAQMQTDARIVLDSINQIEHAFGSAFISSLDGPAALLTDPIAAAADNILTRLADTVARAAFDQSSASSQATITKRYPNVISIFQVAIDVDQDAFDLLSLNAGLMNPYAIDPGTPVLVFA